MTDMQKMEAQSAEFNALTVLIARYKALPAVVDDDYPRQRHYYEAALQAFRDAVARNRPEATGISIFELHQKMTEHLFPAYSNSDERFLALALCGEAGELANMIKKRWRDGVDLTPEIYDELADIRVYLELLAKCFDVEGDKLDMLVQRKLEKVVARFKDRLT